MVETEQRHGLGAEDLHPVQRAAVQHHPAKPHVVVHGGDQAPTARFQSRRRGVGALLPVVLQLEAAAFLGLIAGGEAIELLWRAEKGGVRHPQRLEQPRAQELPEAQARELLDEIAHHIDGHRIVPGRPRREFQRQGGELLDECIQAAGRLEIIDLGLAVGGVDAGAHHEAVGQSRGVGDQIDDLHRPLRPRGQEARRRAGEQGGHAAGVDAQSLPRRDMGADIILQADQAFLGEHHQGHRSDRLAHRIDAEDGVLAHGLAALEVHVAAHAGVDQLAAAIDLGEQARQVAAVDVAARHHLVEPSQPRRRQTHRFRLHHVRIPSVF